jgi:biotin synthase
VPADGSAPSACNDWQLPCLIEVPLRHDWTVDDVAAIYHLPLLELVFRAAQVHRAHHDPAKVQCATLLSIKTGGCSENCGYCSQSAHYKTSLEREQLLGLDTVLDKARAAKTAGSSRFCMGAAWRSVRSGKEFDNVLAMVRGVAALDLEVCVTLGMLTDDQALALKEAGLTAYNHNLDTSEAHYPNVVTTHTYQERLDTLGRVAKAGLHACCGGILGLGETARDRCSLLATLAHLDPHPESVPINVLVPIEGTPLSDAPPVDPLDVVRSVATARIVLPGSRVRLSAGRSTLSDEAQALCFLAGANSIFLGERLLTTPQAPADDDRDLLGRLGLVGA